MQGFTFFFGFGSLLAPLIAQPFLLETDEEYDVHLNYTHVNQTTTKTSSSDILLVYPYSIVACFMLLTSLFLLIVWKIEPQTEEHPSRKETPGINSKKGSSDNHKDQEATGITDDIKKCRNYKFIAVALMMVFAHLYYGLETTFGSFLVTFVVESLGKSKSDGTKLTSLYWGTFTFWRLTTVFYIEYIGSEMNILICLFIILAGNVVLIPFASSSVLCLWIGTAVIGLGVSSIWSAQFGYLEEYFPVTSKMSGSIIVSACVGEFLFPLIISYFVTTAPDVFLWVTLFCSLSLMAIFVILMYVMRVKLGKPKVEKTTEK